MPIKDKINSMNKPTIKPPAKGFVTRTIYIAAALYLAVYAYASGEYRFIQVLSLLLSAAVVYLKIARVFREPVRLRKRMFWEQSSLMLAFLHQTVFYTVVVFDITDMHVNRWSALRVLHLIIAFAIKEIAGAKRHNKWKR